MKKIIIMLNLLHEKKTGQETTMHEVVQVSNIGRCKWGGVWYCAGVGVQKNSPRGAGADEDRMHESSLVGGWSFIPSRTLGPVALKQPAISSDAWL